MRDRIGEDVPATCIKLLADERRRRQLELLADMVGLDIGWAVGQELARPGTRNHALNTAAFSLGRLVSNGLLTAKDTTAALHAAATNAGLSDPEITRTIRSGLVAGIHR